MLNQQRVYINRCTYTIDTIDDFLLGLQELATTQAMNASEIKVDMSSIQKESGLAERKRFEKPPGAREKYGNIIEQNGGFRGTF